MPIDLLTPVADLAVERPSRIPVLESLGLDYCCGGKRPLAEACRAAGLDPAAVVDSLVRSDAQADAAGAEDEIDWTGRPLGDLLDHIVGQHHEYLRRELPRLSDLARKVRAAHGDAHPELAAVEQRLSGLRAELEQHMGKEEQVLFPLIRGLERGEAAAFHCGSVANPIEVMELEHDDAGEALRDLRDRTRGYEPPADACPSYRALMAGLAELERDLHVHIHEENNLLHPRAIALEASRTGGPR